MLTGLVLFVCMLVKVWGGPVTLVNLVVGLPLLIPTTVLHFRSLIERVVSAPRAPDPKTATAP
jgi:hypothetical protein